MKCSGCTTERGKGDRSPMGWHRRGDETFCGDCWGERYVLRAITLPVSGAVDRAWDDLREALRRSWSRSTATANWAVQRLLANDVVRRPDMPKLPKMPPIYLYGLMPQQEKAGWSQSCSAILRTVEQRYRKQRYELIWLQRTSLPNTKYPYPYPVHNSAWKASRGEGGELLVNLPLASERWKLRLRSGRHGRHRNSIAAQFDQIVSGEAIQGEAAIFRRRAAGTHRNGDTDRDGGGQRVPYEVVLKLVAWFPRQAGQGKLTGMLFVAPDPDGLLVAVNAKKDRLWAIHADHVWRWAASHKEQLARWSDDTKMEERRHRQRLASRREAASEKYRHRLDTAVKQIAAQTVGYARRCGFAAVRWVDGPERAGFPWFALTARIGQLCCEAGIAFVKGGADEGEEED